MTAYSTIADSEIDPESPGTTTLFTKLRDNPTAIAEGSSGAPKIRPSAFGVESGYMYLGNESDGGLNYASNTNIASDELYCSSLNVQNGVTLGVSESSNGFIIIRCTGIATIAGTINLDGKGVSGGVLGVTANTVGVTGGTGLLGGAGGGGMGGSTPVNGGAGGGAYGSSGGAYSVNHVTNASTAAAILARIESYMERHSGTLYPSAIDNGVVGGGGGGSGATGSSSVDGADGGNGGGCVIIIADEIDFTGAITCDGNNGANTGHSSAGSAGGGGGGFVLLVARNFINSSGSITATGGTGGSGYGYNAGNGADGHFKLITVG